MGFIALFVLALICIYGANGFRNHGRPSIKRFATKVHVSTVELAGIYDQMKQKIKGAMQAQAASVPPQLLYTVDSFLGEYLSSNVEAGTNPEQAMNVIQVLLKEVMKAIVAPYKFAPYHEAIREPFDYYKWANDFFSPLLKMDRSKFIGVENIKKIEEYIAKGENVIILSNHQTEADPQVISLLLEKEGLGHIAEKMIFVAGHKVTSDPVAIPFSMGRNLICIHSKKHIKANPEDVGRKSQENLESMKALGDLCAKGGAVIWVAPSGGRDRPNEETNKFTVAPYDLKALDMFKLIAMQSRKPTHFFPMAMFSHQLVPPPKTVSSGLGEERSAKRGEVSVHLLDETDGLGGLKDKAFCETLQKRVEDAYEGLCQYHYSSST